MLTPAQKNWLIAVVVVLIVVAIWWWYHEENPKALPLYLGGRKDRFRGAYGRTPEMLNCWIGGNPGVGLNACGYV